MAAAVAAGTRPRLVLDLGANDGRYSRLAAGHADYVVAVEQDPTVVDELYRQLRSEGQRRILPLVLDLADPSPGGGWRGVERAGFAERASADVVLALAVVHHLAIGRNVPLPEVIDWLVGLTAPGGGGGGGVRPPGGPDGDPAAGQQARRSLPGLPTRHLRDVARRPGTDHRPAGTALGHPHALPDGDGWLNGDGSTAGAAETGSGAGDRRAGRPRGHPAAAGRARPQPRLLPLPPRRPGPDPAAGRPGDGGPHGRGGAARRAQPPRRPDHPGHHPHRAGRAAGRRPRRAGGPARDATSGRTAAAGGRAGRSRRRGRTPAVAGAGPGAATGRRRSGGLRDALPARLTHLGGGPAARRRRRGRHRAGLGRAPAGGHADPRRAAAGQPARRGREDRRRAVPALRRVGRRLHLVPQLHRGQRVDAQRAAGDAHRPLPGAVGRPALLAVPGQHLHRLRRPVRHPRRGEHHPALPTQPLRAAGHPGAGARRAGPRDRQTARPGRRADGERRRPGRLLPRADPGRGRPGRRRTGAGRPEVPLGQPGRQPAGPVHQLPRRAEADRAGPPCTSCTC